MTSTVDQSWDRIVDWLTEHAPATLERIGPPADNSAIAAARHAVGAELPADLVAWWRRANGSASTWSPECLELLPFFRPCSIEVALSRRETWWQVWHDQTIEQGWLTEETFTRGRANPAGTQAGTWLPEFVPIASNWGGEDLFVDLRSGPRRGCVREFDRVYTDRKPRWTGVTAMLCDIAAALEGNGAIDGHHAHVDPDGILYWE